MARRKPKCRQCGDEIDFMPYQQGNNVRYYPVNLDDRKAHGPRCRLTLELKAARTKKRKPSPPQSGPQQRLL